MRWRTFVGVILSVVCAGLFYFVWMATFLLTRSLHNPIVEAALWLSAPVVTATGFATGIALSENNFALCAQFSRTKLGSCFWTTPKTGRTRFHRIFIWPLIGCAIGAGVVYWFGPMLIVFGMFVAGTASVVLREVLTWRNRT